MPPDNTPNATRPSTPPRRNPSLFSHPYLQQLEEAISTSVPDLASTLTTPESRLRTARPAPTAWAGQPTTMDDRSRADSSREGPMASRELDLAASLDRMQSELDRWQTERNRLRTFLHNQQNRQSILEQQNSRLREEHSRLVDEHSRLSSSITGAPSSRPADPSPASHEQSTLSSLASAIAEVGRDNYATRGVPPQRQRLYDWAAAPARTSQQGTNNDTFSDVVDPSSARHRELDRALRNYRMARNSLRSDRPSSSDLGAVPTASALRAYWSEESHEESRSESTSQNPSFALNQFVENHRRERQRRAAQDSNSNNANYNQITSNTNLYSTPQPPTTSDSSAALKTRIRNTIHYLSELRNTPSSSTLDLARHLDLDTLYESDDASTTLPSDLPLLVDSLPVPQHSSWLVPGMTWQGLQSTDRESGISSSSSGGRNGSTLPAAVLRRMRQREYIGRAMARRGIVDAQAVAEGMMERERTRDWEREREREWEHEGPHVGSGLDTERYISDLMRDTDGRWGFREGRGEEGLPLPPPLAGGGGRAYDAVGTTATDHWPVTVTVHGVDWEAMEVTGTMRASQIPDHRTAVPGEERERGGRSMESFFKGEIIDFRRHSLETEGKSRGYRDGGVDVDARYWAGVGPFKEAISKGVVTVGHAGELAGGEVMGNGPLFAGGLGSGIGNGDTALERGWLDDEEKLKLLMADASSDRLWSRSKTERESREEKEWEAHRVMSRCVGSQRWLREKVGREWILMRWKETCFVDPIIRPSSSPSTQHTTTTTTTDLSSSAAQATWGLTISGFYYIALHRQTGRIEGLYYDPGSQPFQRLGMMPEDGRERTRMRREGRDKEGPGEGKRLNGDDDGDGMGVVQGRRDEGLDVGEGEGTVPVKRWFPSLEFR